METVKIEVPAALLKAANPNATDPSREAAQLMALELFREEKVSLSRAAELCGTPLAAFMDFVAAHEVSPSVTESGNWKKTAAPWPNSVCDRRRSLTCKSRHERWSQASIKQSITN
jgi:predicted HTH domain antitoxin